MKALAGLAGLALTAAAIAYATSVPRPTAATTDRCDAAGMRGPGRRSIGSRRRAPVILRSPAGGEHVGSRLLPFQGASQGDRGSNAGSTAAGCRPVARRRLQSVALRPGTSSGCARSRQRQAHSLRPIRVERVETKPFSDRPELLRPRGAVSGSRAHRPSPSDRQTRTPSRSSSPRLTVASPVTPPGATAPATSSWPSPTYRARRRSGIPAGGTVAGALAGGSRADDPPAQSAREPGSLQERQLPALLLRDGARMRARLRSGSAGCVRRGRTRSAGRRNRARLLHDDRRRPRLGRRHKPLENRRSNAVSSAVRRVGDPELGPR